MRPLIPRQERLRVLYTRLAAIQTEIATLTATDLDLDGPDFLTPTPPPRRGRPPKAPCGTEAAYQRHAKRWQRHSEPIPDDCGCRQAHADHERAAAAQRKLDRAS